MHRDRTVHLQQLNFSETIKRINGPLAENHWIILWSDIHGPYKKKAQKWLFWDNSWEENSCGREGQSQMETTQVMRWKETG